MKAVMCRRWGPPESLTVETIADPVPRAGEVVVEVEAAGVNFPDVLVIQDKYQFKPLLPFSPGCELAGVVRAVGDDVTGIAPGERVMAYVGHGAFAERAVVPAEAIVKVPQGMPSDVAASLLLAYGTAYHSLADRARLGAGETLLVLGAAGGVGLAAIEIGKALGARVIAAASSPGKLALCRQHGADETIDYAAAELRGAIREATNGAGPDVVFDPVGGEPAEPAFRSIAWRGRYLVVGFASGGIPRLPWNLALLKGASLVGVFWGDFVRREPSVHRAALDTLLAWFADGRIRPHVSARYSLAETAQALSDMAARRVTGKIVIEPGR
ncbi:MAG: NADPH:quinone oxidoreductase family protein [Burkholderiaceae bacterium]